MALMADAVTLLIAILSALIQRVAPNRKSLFNCI